MGRTDIGTLVVLGMLGTGAGAHPDTPSYPTWSTPCWCCPSSSHPIPVSLLLEFRRRTPLEHLVELWNGQSRPSKCSAPQEVILCVVVAASTEDPLASAVSGRPVFLPFVPEPQVESQIHLILVEAGNPGLGLSSRTLSTLPFFVLPKLVG